MVYTAISINVVGKRRQASLQDGKGVWVEITETMKAHKYVQND